MLSTKKKKELKNLQDLKKELLHQKKMQEQSQKEYYTTQRNTGAKKKIIENNGAHNNKVQDTESESDYETIQKRKINATMDIDRNYNIPIKNNFGILQIDDEFTQHPAPSETNKNNIQEKKNYHP
ncbi:hypothetical protein WA026_021512 [Henosepilachna vigintioctopunctata]|uniref:Uncharacterized protein n=1 Tax=Henosepilachna vigintioctopunctata TaxID=420089 RepID=A0AAW1VGE6_9CUCU